MEVFRISKAQYAADLTGTGAKIAGGRWNKPGTAVLYTSGSRALATLEVLVHIPAFYVPSDYVLSTLWIPDDSIQHLNPELLPDRWQDLTPNENLRTLADAWLKSTACLTLKVPSAIVAGEFNYLINPLHPIFAEVKLLRREAYRFDPRLI
ncbi:MAG: RES family NAD+ phosphorylase [Spirosomataceae bacterium]